MAMKQRYPSIERMHQELSAAYRIADDMVCMLSIHQHAHGRDLAEQFVAATGQNHVNPQVQKRALIDWINSQPSLTPDEKAVRVGAVLGYHQWLLDAAEDGEADSYDILPDEMRKLVASWLMRRIEFDGNSGRM